MSIRPSDDSVISSTSNVADLIANAEAIDRQIGTTKYRHIVAWGKWLGFTPKTVEKYVREAEVQDVPEDVVQRIDGTWIRLCDIANESNRNRVEEIARQGL